MPAPGQAPGTMPANRQAPGMMPAKIQAPVIMLSPPPAPVVAPGIMQAVIHPGLKGGKGKGKGKAKDTKDYNGGKGKNGYNSGNGKNLPPTRTLEGNDRPPAEAPATTLSSLASTTGSWQVVTNDHIDQVPADNNSSGSRAAVYTIF